LRTFESPAISCSGCKGGQGLPFQLSMAFQPIVDTLANRVYAYEALVRGVANEPAGHILAQLTEANRYAFDQQCRVKAIELAVRLGMPATGAKLSINFMPGAVYSPAACIKLTLDSAARLAFPLDRLIFEITETEQVKDRKHLVSIAEEYRKHGFQMALDDLGSGFSGLNLLADVKPEIVKIDMDLIRGIDRRPTAFLIVQKLTELCHSLGIEVVGEGVETEAEFASLRACGIRLMQGYLLAKPAFEALPAYTLPLSIPGAADGPQHRPHAQPALAHIPQSHYEAQQPLAVSASS
jgi:EAL domain-containing protein (putative c-di-GMP-specific phosphodiesterase class I)